MFLFLGISNNNSMFLIKALRSTKTSILTFLKSLAKLENLSPRSTLTFVDRLFSAEGL